MRIVTANVNGIRSAAAKGFFDWFRTQRADVLCLQETRASPEQLAAHGGFLPKWTRCWNTGEVPGYSGVAVWSRREPDAVLDRLGWAPFDREGRYLELRFGPLSVVSLYLPSGSARPERQQFKFEVMAFLEPQLAAWRDSGREYVVCGDWNIAHEAIDLKNWRANQKNSGFLPEERAWLTRLFGEHRFVDAHRALKPGVAEYTWWSNRGQAWANNVGWRIDYQVATPGLRAHLGRAQVYRERRFSDHAPLTIDYAL